MSIMLCVVAVCRWHCMCCCGRRIGDGVRDGVMGELLGCICCVGVASGGGVAMLCMVML